MAVTPAEAILIEGLRSGQEEAYEQLIERFQQPIYTLVSRLVHDPSDACDVTQEVFVKIFRSVDSFREQSTLRTWIYRIAVNEAHNHRRWFGRKRGHEVGLEDEHCEGLTYEQVLPDPGLSPFEFAMNAETRERVEDALRQMRPVFRSAVILRDIDGLSYDEIADVLQISIGTVKSRILRGREALREILEGNLSHEHSLRLAGAVAD
jgi:RNA polymerase sigma-70 factor (ECF subfamily)